MDIHLSRLVLVTFALALALSARAEIGVTVNGADIAVASGTGWTYDGTSITLAGAGPYVISGGNIQGWETNAVTIRAAADCTVIASNLVIDVSGTGRSPTAGVPAFDCGTNAVTLALWSDEGTTNVFKGGWGCAGVAVASNFVDDVVWNASLAITNLNESAALLATGGEFAAGIGMNRFGLGSGTVTISGGRIMAVGGAWGAGIGGVNGGAGGTVTISGGTVTATGGDYGAGIGGSYSGYNGGAGVTAPPAGGTAAAVGGACGAGIGGGYGGAGGTVTVSGGTVTATG